ncbi:4-alpha-glucanotransferase [Hydrogenoanaerobacterium sp.]|uniref:4-alpha-glucanotransferase n=1 Tax=Hydrogenoanaerobacterium sp. TaxID=2953763 RepID=UPI0028A0CFBD|nr:4-alpha-glucanotransferase [Hydrogenoanaerobacterium sp.]
MQTTTFTRAAGVLLPVASLPSPYGIGSFGKAAYRWVDFLNRAGQSYWQVLPLSPTGFGDSPYQSCSAFAGNPYFIDLDLLCEQGLLQTSDCTKICWGSAGAIDYKAIFDNRETLLRKAYAAFSDLDALKAFRRGNHMWIEDYALYMAIKTQNELRPWWEWPKDVLLRDAAALQQCRESLRDDINYHIFVQYLFFQQWGELKAYANRKGIEIIGDIPIYVAMDSADTWSNSQLFLLDRTCRPIDVAGVPPDGFSSTGQLWGNPLYRWDHMKQDGYRWWIERLRFSLSLYDVLRIDHFRGFDSYYAVPYGDKTAANGEWRKGPGIDFIQTVNTELGKHAQIIAEDLGYLTDGVRELLRQSGYPGMKVLQFAFDSREDSDYMPHNYNHHCVVYTGTHDNDTVRGWFSSAPTDDVVLAQEYLGLKDGRDGNWAFIRAALGSVANVAIIPVQDYLNLGSEARINIPSTLGGNNWRWRLDEKLLDNNIADKIATMTALYGRSPATLQGGETNEPVSK